MSKITRLVPKHMTGIREQGAGKFTHHNSYVCTEMELSLDMGVSNMSRKTVFFVKCLNKYNLLRESRNRKEVNSNR